MVTKNRVISDLGQSNLRNRNVLLAIIFQISIFLNTQGGKNPRMQNKMYWMLLKSNPCEKEEVKGYSKVYAMRIT